MTDGDSDGSPDASRPEIPDEMPDEDEVIDEIAGGFSLSPAEHERVKNVVHGGEYERIKRFDRRYLVVGTGEDGEAGDRRQLVYNELGSRTNPSAIATQLEDYDLTKDEMRLWVRVFDVLCGMCTQIAVVVENFDGGYVWELGLVFAPSYREKAWVLKRRYRDEKTERARYANGMAISHVELLLTGERGQEWTDTAELREAVSTIP
jgi:hypothetical protein